MLICNGVSFRLIACDLNGICVSCVLAGDNTRQLLFNSILDRFSCLVLVEICECCSPLVFSIQSDDLSAVSAIGQKSYID